MTSNMPDGEKKHCKSAKPESHQWTMVFLHKTAAFYTKQCPSPWIFTISKSHKAFESVTIKLWLHLRCHFTHAQKALRNETQSLLGNAELKILSVCIETGRVNPH